MLLNCHTYFSFRYGLLSVEELLQHAQREGVRKLVLTDINNTSGVIDFVRRAPGFGVEPVAGVEFRSYGQIHYVGVAHNNEGFHELNMFLTGCLRHGTTVEPEIPEVPPFSVNVSWVVPFEESALNRMVEGLHFSACKQQLPFYIGVRPDQLSRLRLSPWSRFSERLVAWWPVTFRQYDDREVHRMLRAVDRNVLLSRVTDQELAAWYEVMPSYERLSNAYREAPELLLRAVRILEPCGIAFDFGESKNKRTFSGSRILDRELLRRETMKGLEQRYPDNASMVMERVDKELTMIEDLGFATYFLINWDIVRYARHRGYFHVGRGSGANSIVAYCLHITDVDPVELDLYFERFINPYRTSPPDFDIDFSWKDRDDVIGYVFHRHGREHVALLATYSTFQFNAAVRELGKVFGLPKAEIDAMVDHRLSRSVDDHMKEGIRRVAMRIADFPSHLSIHAGGILISEKPLSWYTAANLPPKGFPTTQFSMLEAEDIGLYKYDILSQRGLGHIRDTVDLVRRNHGIEIDIHDVKRFKEDPAVRRLIREGRCMGCFYVESPAMRMLLKKLRVDRYIQLVAASSIIRPGVAKSGMMREYILRTHDPSRRTYIHPVMEELMEETYGIMVYQEDVIKVAHHFAGLSLSEADVLRRGMSGKFRSREEFARIRDRFYSNCRERGYAEAITAEVWRQIESFAGYSFSKGHSASYAVESYQSLFLKAYYPKEFLAGVINNFGGFYRTEFYVHEARMCGANVHAPCINRSVYLTDLRGDDLILGFVHLAGLEQTVAGKIVDEREMNGCYLGLHDFSQRVSVTIDQLRLLVRVGAFRFTGRTKKQLLWDLHGVMGDERHTTVSRELFVEDAIDIELPELYSGPHDDAMDEIELLGFPLCSPFDLLRSSCADSPVAADFPELIGRSVTVVGYLVTSKYTSTVKRDTMVFGTFIDREGRYFDTTHFPDVVSKYPLRGRGCYRISGKVDAEFGCCSITVHSLEKLETAPRG
ncbi:MAG: DNA polymerase III subunit alpha [Bacteroidota bacterium]